MERDSYEQGGKQQKKGLVSFRRIDNPGRVMRPLIPPRRSFSLRLGVIVKLEFEGNCMQKRVNHEKGPAGPSGKAGRRANGKGQTGGLHPSHSILIGQARVSRSTLPGRKRNRPGALFRGEGVEGRAMGSAKRRVSPNTHPLNSNWLGAADQPC